MSDGTGPTTLPRSMESENAEALGLAGKVVDSGSTNLYAVADVRCARDTAAGQCRNGRSHMGALVPLLLFAIEAICIVAVGKTLLTVTEAFHNPLAAVVTALA